MSTVTMSTVTTYESSPECRQALMSRCTVVPPKVTSMSTIIECRIVIKVALMTLRNGHTVASTVNVPSS